MNRGSIRYRRASFVEHLKVHRDNPSSWRSSICSARRAAAGRESA